MPQELTPTVPRLPNILMEGDDEIDDLIRKSVDNNETGFCILRKYRFYPAGLTQPEGKTYCCLQDALFKAERELKESLNYHYNFTLEDYKEKMRQLARGEDVQMNFWYKIAVHRIC